jgi:hypothetical protein
MLWDNRESPRRGSQRRAGSSLVHYRLCLLPGPFVIASQISWLCFIFTLSPPSFWHLKGPLLSLSWPSPLWSLYEDSILAQTILSSFLDSGSPVPPSLVVLILIIHKLSISQHPTSALKMESVCFSEMLVSSYKSTQYYYPEDQHRHFQCHENLKSQS